MSAFQPLLLPCVLGFLIAHLFLRHSRLPARTLLAAALAAPVGLSTVSLLVFWAHVLWPDHAKALVAASSTVLCLALAFGTVIPRPSAGTASAGENRSGARPLSLILTAAAGAAFTAALLLSIQSYASQASWDIFGGWDARYLWNVKARFYARSSPDWQAMFSPVLRLWVLPDYPLMLPGSVAWGWMLAGREALLWPVAVAFSFYLSLIFLLLAYLAVSVSWQTALIGAAFLASVFQYRFWSAVQYADVPTAFFMTGSVFLLVLAFRNKVKSWTALAGYLAGMAAWTKNEGFLFVFLSVLLLGFVLAITSSSWTDKAGYLLTFVAGLMLPVLSAVYVKIFLGGPGIHLGSERSFSDVLSLLADSSRTKLIALAFLAFKSQFSLWSGLWIFFASALTYAFLFQRKQLVSDYRWLPLAFLLLIEAGYFLVYQITPLRLAFHLQTSLGRLFLHTGVLALAVVLDTLGFGPTRPSRRE
jgi:hypothetical protein